MRAYSLSTPTSPRRAARRQRLRIEGLEDRSLPSSAAFVKDINLIGTNSMKGPSVQVGGLAYFPASDAIHGTELWKTDGTEAVTGLVKDIVPGQGNSDLSWITALGGMLVFTVDDRVHGRELWRSDGTEAGTVLVKDISPGVEDSAPSDLTV